jgi:hypothetical protein
MKFNYYYNNVPGDGLCRNNLIYTSLISEDQKTFCQWYHNDSEYHKGKNEVVDPNLMDEKWDREVRYLTLMSKKFPESVPVIKDIDVINKKIYLEINGVDFWQEHFDKNCTYDQVLPNWQDQMIEIFQQHKSIGLWKYSLHPSSYFIVDGKLKSINYFFTYETGEGPITVKDHLSHISKERREKMKTKTDAMGIGWEDPQSLHTMQLLTFESFRNNFPKDFIERARNVFF